MLLKINNKINFHKLYISSDLIDVSLTIECTVYLIHFTRRKGQHYTKLNRVQMENYIYSIKIITKEILRKSTKN